MRPLSFNIFIIDLFLILNNITNENEADDSTHYCTYNSFEDVVSCSERAADDLFRWFSNTGMRTNVNKCHLLLGTQKK